MAPFTLTPSLSLSCVKRYDFTRTQVNHNNVVRASQRLP